MRNLLLAATAAAGLAFASPAYAGTILDFAQAGTANTITGTANGAGTSTTITGNLTVNIDAIIGPLAGSVPITATMVLNATSVGNATTTTIGGSTFTEQGFSGSFSISAAACGTNCLSGTFTDAVFGSGPSLTLSVGSAPGESITFTSSTIPLALLGPPEGMSLSFVGVTPPVGITGTTLSSFASTVTGNFSAEAVATPEPASLALLGLGVLGLAAVRRRSA